MTDHGKRGPFDLPRFLTRPHGCRAPLEQRTLQVLLGPARGCDVLRVLDAEHEDTVALRIQILSTRHHEADVAPSRFGSSWMFSVMLCGASVLTTVTAL